MTLSLAIMSRTPGADWRGTAGWGSWSFQPGGDPTTLATSRDVLSSDATAVLVLVAEADTAAARIAAATIAAVRPDVPVRVEPVPASLGVLLRAVERVPATTTSASGVFASVSAALAGTTWGAWLPSVARLERPAPSMRQHVQSWFMSGEGFLAVHGSPGWVANLPLAGAEGRRLPRPSPTAAGPGEYECHTFGELPERGIAALFAMGLEKRPVRRGPLGDAEAVWGSGKAVEFVITPAGAADPGRPSGSCPVCGDPVWGRTCPFCRASPGATVDTMTQGAVG